MILVWSMMDFSDVGLEVWIYYLYKYEATISHNLQQRKQAQVCALLRLALILHSGSTTHQSPPPHTQLYNFGR